MPENSIFSFNGWIFFQSLLFFFFTSKSFVYLQKTQFPPVGSLLGLMSRVYRKTVYVVVLNESQQEHAQPQTLVMGIISNTVQIGCSFKDTLIVLVKTALWFLHGLTFPSSNLAKYRQCSVGQSCAGNTTLFLIHLRCNGITLVRRITQNLYLGTSLGIFVQ